MHNGDTTVLSSLLNMLSTHLIYGALSDNQQDSIMFYEIHVCGKNAFSTSIVSVGELTFDEWNTQFNH